MFTKESYLSNDLPSIMINSSKNSKAEVLQKIKGLLEVPSDCEILSRQNNQMTNTSSGDAENSIDKVYHQSIVSKNNVQMIAQLCLHAVIIARKVSIR